jgi:hypothetical protein
MHYSGTFWKAIMGHLDIAVQGNKPIFTENEGSNGTCVMSICRAALLNTTKLRDKEFSKRSPSSSLKRSNYFTPVHPLSSNKFLPCHRNHFFIGLQNTHKPLQEQNNKIHITHVILLHSEEIPTKRNFLL